MAEISEEELRVYVSVHHRLHPQLSSRDIGKLVGRDQKWVLRWWTAESPKNKPRGNVSSPKLAKADVAFVKRKVKGTKRARGGDRKRKASLREVVEQLSEERKVDVCVNTVRQTLHDSMAYRRPRKKPRLTADHRQRREKFCLDYRRCDWGTVLNSDSSPFYLESVYNSQNDGTWVDLEDDPDDVPTAQVDSLKRRIRKELRDPHWFAWLRKTFDSLPDRIEAVIAAKGGHTKY